MHTCTLFLLIFFSLFAFSKDRTRYVQQENTLPYLLAATTKPDLEISERRRFRARVHIQRARLSECGLGIVAIEPIGTLMMHTTSLQTQRLDANTITIGMRICKARIKNQGWRAHTPRTWSRLQMSLLSRIGVFIHSDPMISNIIPILGTGTFR
ncbi:hypothetical protein BXZ70DRAFT_211661 [Cristinia sonorae]|uniref:Secreted protein n=1 Tax=Cristinia sonorae TaxID=1940300 RepID=A0A8K0XP91_9AGAR|nr:hypothetical protein BXZ70DRAFT_211661 [Cristinia sonorae]